MACATGFGFGDKYCLNWQRETKIRTVQAHVPLTVVILVDERERAVIMGCETGGPYASEVEMLRNILKGFDRFERVPFIADRCYEGVVNNFVSPSHNKI